MLREQMAGCTRKKKAKIVIEQNYYELSHIIGQGTFGKVYQGIDLRNGQKVAIKEVYQDSRYKNRELEVISRLDNDNVIFMKDYYFIDRKDDKYLYLVMDYYESNLQTLLRDFRKEKKTLDSKVRKIISFQIFKGLYYLECNSICHRDLKPPNILIDPTTYQLRICDFGSAKIFDKTDKNVAYICSRYYRAPQLLFEYTAYRTEIDVWSAGCILVELLTNQPIFPGDSSLQQLIEIIKILGSPTKKYIEKYAYELNEQFCLPKVTSTGWDRILKRYKPEDDFIDLLSKILVYDLEQRLKPIEVLKHKYFHDICTVQFSSLTQKLPNLFGFNKLRTAKNSKQILLLQQLYCQPYQKTLKMSNTIKNDCFKTDTQDSTPLCIEAKQNRKRSRMKRKFNQNQNIATS